MNKTFVALAVTLSLVSASSIASTTAVTGNGPLIYTQTYGNTLERGILSKADAASVDSRFADQTGVDAAQNEHINAVQDAAQTANDRATGLESRADTVEGAVRETNAQLEVTDQRSQNNAVRLDGVEGKNTEQDAAIAGKVDQSGYNTDKATQAQTDAATNQRIDEDRTTLAGHDSRITTAQANGDYAQSRIDAANANIEAGRAAQDSTNKRVAQHSADIASHEQRITGLEQSTNARFSDLKSQVDDNRKRASAAVAGVAGMANIPQVLEHQTFNVGAGAGYTDGESALAVGFSARAAKDVVVKAAVSTDTQHNFVVGAGVAYGW